MDNPADLVSSVTISTAMPETAITEQVVASQVSAIDATLVSMRKDFPELTGLRFTPAAWNKLLYMLHRGNTEVGCFGVSDKDDLLLVRNIVLVKQTCTSVSVDFDEDSVGEYMLDCVDAGISAEHSTRIFIHTHPDMSPRPSSTDESTFLTAFGKCNWAVMFIIARKHATFCRLRFNVGPGGEFELPVNVDWRAGLSVDDQVGSCHLWEAEYQRCVTSGHMGFAKSAPNGFGIGPFQQNYDQYQRSATRSYYTERSDVAWDTDAGDFAGYKEQRFHRQLPRHYQQEAVLSSSSVWEDSALVNLGTMTFEQVRQVNPRLAGAALQEFMLAEYSDAQDVELNRERVKESYQVRWDYLPVETRCRYLRDGKQELDWEKPAAVADKGDAALTASEDYLFNNREDGNSELVDSWLSDMAAVPYETAAKEYPILMATALGLFAEEVSMYRSAEEVTAAMLEPGSAEWSDALVAEWDSYPFAGRCGYLVDAFDTSTEFDLETGDDEAVSIDPTDATRLNESIPMLDDLQTLARISFQALYESCPNLAMYVLAVIYGGTISKEIESMVENFKLCFADKDKVAKFASGIAAWDAYSVEEGYACLVQVREHMLVSVSAVKD